MDKRSLKPYLERISTVFGTVSLLALCVIMGASIWLKNVEEIQHNSVLSIPTIGLLISLLAYVLRLVLYYERNLKTLCLLLFHLGLLLGFSGFAVSTEFSEIGSIYIREGDTVSVWFDRDEKQHPLPYKLKLLDYKVEVHPGTMRAKSYSSVLEIEHNSTHRTETLSVNHPLEIDGTKLFQQSAGIEPSKRSYIEAEISSRSFSATVQTNINRKFELNTVDGTAVTVIDYTPSAGIKEGRIVTVNPDMKLNPAYLVSVTRNGYESDRRWVVPSQPETEDFGDFTLHFVDFHNIEYTVISYTKPRGELLIYLGMLFAALSAVAMLFAYSRKQGTQRS